MKATLHKPINICNIYILPHDPINDTKINKLDKHLTSSNQPTKMYTFCNLFLSCSAFTVRLRPASNLTSEISSNPERDKQATWEKTLSSRDRLLYFYISIPYMKYLVHIHFIVYRTLSKFSFFLNIRVSTHIHTQRNIQQTRVSYTHTRTHIQEYSTDYISVAERKNFKLLFSAGIILPLGFRIYIFRPMRMIHAILSGWLPRTK